MRKYSSKMATIIQALRAPAVLAVISCLVLGVASFAHADSIQQQIDNLNAQNAQANSTLGSLQVQASSYQDAINKLQSQIASIQNAINANQIEQASLQQQIQDDQNKIAQQKQLLSQDIESMYVNGQMSTIEMLATSSDLSSFIDAETYRGAVQTKLQGLLTQIAQLENQLENQKTQIANLINSQQQQETTLSNDQAQQTQLLAMNQSQQASYNQQIQANQTKIDQLIAEQIAINQASEGSIHYGGTGSYPYANAVCLNDPPGSYNDNDCNALKHPGLSSSQAYNWGYPPSSSEDPLGWSYRNCTSYAFWKVAQVTGSQVIFSASHFPNEIANGGGVKYSIPDFEAMGYSVNHDPNGSVVLAVQTAGTYGHIMFVEGVSGTNAYISQYNEAGDGLYSTGTISSTTSSILFVHVK